MNKPGELTTQQILLAYFDQLGPEELVRPQQVASATGLLQITVEDVLRTLARQGLVGKKRKGRTPYYRRARTTAEKAWWKFCFINAAMYGNKDAKNALS